MLRPLLLVLALTGALPAIATAQATPFEELVREGVERFAAHDYTGALARFERAHRQRPSARTHRAIGLCNFELGSYRDAVIHLEAAIVTTVNPLTDEQRASASEALANAYQHVGRFQLRVSPLTAQVLLDDRRVGADARLVLDAPGTYELVASARGYAPQRRQLEVYGGEEEEIRVRLEPGAEPPPPDPATTDPEPPTRPAARGPNYGAIVSFSLGGVGLVMALITGPWAIVEHDALEQRCSDTPADCGPSPAPADDDFDKVTRLGLVADIGLAIAGTGALAGALLLIFAGDEAGGVADSRRVFPLIGHDLAGVGLAGSF